MIRVCLTIAEVREALIAKLSEYDETRNIDFFAFTKAYVMDEIHELIR